MVTQKRELVWDSFESCLIGHLEEQRDPRSKKLEVDTGVLGS